MRLEYKIDPFPAVRSNRNSSWTPRTQKYHAQMNHIRVLAHKDIQTLIDAFIDGNYHITFVFEMPKSWSKKKREENIGEPHRSKPDIDNLCKAMWDSIFYQRAENDSSISCIHASKIWGETGKIMIDFEK